MNRPSNPTRRSRVPLAPQHGHCHKDHHHIGDDAQGDLETFSAAVDHGFVDRYPAQGAKGKKKEHQAGNDPGGNRLAVEDCERDQGDQAAKGENADPEGIGRFRRSEFLVVFTRRFC